MLAQFECAFSVTSPSPETLSDVRCSPSVQSCAPAYRVCVCSVPLGYYFWSRWLCKPTRSSMYALSTLCDHELHPQVFLSTIICIPRASLHYQQHHLPLCENCLMRDYQLDREGTAGACMWGLRGP